MKNTLHFIETNDFLPLEVNEIWGKKFEKDMNKIKKRESLRKQAKHK